MLFTNSPKINDVVSFRLASGEEIIGKLQAITGKSYTIHRPIGVTSQMRGQSLEIGFAPFMVSIDERVSVTFEAVDLSVKPIGSRSDIADNYRQVTADIELAPSTLIRP